MLSPVFGEAGILDLSGNFVSTEVVVLIDNLVEDLPVQAKLVVRAKTCPAVEIPLEGCMLQSSGNGKAHLSLPLKGVDRNNRFHLDLAKLKIYGKGEIDLIVESSRFGGTVLSKTNWARFDREFCFKFDDTGEMLGIRFDQEVGVEAALHRGFFLEKIQVGQPVQMMFTKLPPELQASKLRIGFKVQQHEILSTELQLGKWSEPFSFGVLGNSLHPELVGKDGKIDATLVVDEIIKGKKGEVSQEVFSVLAAHNSPVPKLVEFQFEDASGTEIASHPLMWMSSVKWRKPFWKLRAAFSDVFPTAVFSLDLMFTYSADGALAEFEALQFLHSNLMGQAVAPGADKPEWTYRIPFSGGMTEQFIVADLVRAYALSPVNFDHPIQALLCQASPKAPESVADAKNKSAKNSQVFLVNIPLEFSTTSVGRLARAPELVPRRISNTGAKVASSKSSEANALGSKILNVVSGVTGSSKCGSTLEDVLALQMASLAGVAAELKKQGKSPPERWDDRDTVLKALDPSTRWNEDKLKFQFMTISMKPGESFGLTAEKLQEWLDKRKIGKTAWSLDKMGKVFVDKAIELNVNVLYFVAHCISENGGNLTYKNAFNAFGINAVDTAAKDAGSEYANSKNWTTPQKAIEGGMKFIVDNYAENTKYMQNTAYKIRWNPMAPTVHQYCTGLVWADNFARVAHELSQLAPTSEMAKVVFDYTYYEGQTKPV